MSKKKKLAVGIGLCLLALCICAFMYVQNYYRSEVSVADYEGRSPTVSVSRISEGLFIDGPGTERAMIFYPGAKVEYTAYLSILYALAEQGTDCYLVKMPCNLAFLGVNKAEKIMANADYDSWYMAGHSLGGAMAASFAEKHAQELTGLVLLAAYPTSEDSEDDLLKMLAIYGSEDSVLDVQKVLERCPSRACIEGGNHAQFGNYGIQKGDSEAAISREEQQELTVQTIIEFMDGR